MDPCYMEETIVFEAKTLLPVIKRAIKEASLRKTKTAARKLQRFRKWQTTLEQWQEIDIPEEFKAQKFDQLRALFVWDSERYERD